MNRQTKSKVTTAYARLFGVIVICKAYIIAFQKQDLSLKWTGGNGERER